ncbi:MAG: M20/M25/M40 family metallo-hydrolase [Blastocatellia bacterium]|nr:M20/M25/M40 family metallo-hydrolase [Blastocatellia bacterium]MBN8725380.1 M20/M25/M40 family metallo-hydrolase [Acidobacteriota bacterium]
MKKFLLNLILFCLLLSPLNSVLAQNPGATGVDKINASAMKDYLYFIASDEMEGRDTPSKGLNMTAKFLAMNLSMWGLKPGGDNGSYFQKIQIRRNKTDRVNSSVTFGGQSFKLGEDFFAFPNETDLTAPLVFASHGWVIKSKNINPYQNLDIKDKIVVISNGFPQGLSYNDLTGNEGEDWFEPFDYIEKNGGKAVILIPSFESLASWDRTVSYFEEQGQTIFEKLEEKSFSLPVISPSPKLLIKMFSEESQSANSIFRDVSQTIAPFELKQDKKISLKIAVKAEKEVSQNVIAILEGSDPTLKNEYVAIGAHYDHVGVGSPVNGDKIYNGADDDGSGTVAVLQLAEAFSHAPSRPKRSIMFVWHCGEEKGLLGSRYLMKFPTVPLNQIITQLNIDMIGRSKEPNDTKPANKELSGPDEIYVIGSKLMSSELGQVSESVNNSYLKLKFNYTYDDPNDPNRFFYRSDHYNYARKGIPIIFYFNGVHEDYHKPSDSPDKIDYQKMEKVTRTIYMTTLDLANRASRPVVDNPLPDAYTRERD